MDKILFILILLYIFYIIETHCQSTINPRGWPGCSLINTKLYCFGGFTINSTNSHYSPINDHISLDLSLFKNFTTFNKNDIQWKILSNVINDNDNDLSLQPRGMVSTVPIYSQKSFLIYGGFSEQSPTSSSTSNHFAEYKTDEDAWKSLDIRESTYTPSSAIINLGNDTIWEWGGKSSSSSNSTTNVVNIYDYHSDSWSKPMRYHWPMRSQFTATLARDGYIYIMGGYYQSNTNKNMNADFQNVLRFNTNTSLWSNITATGNIPTNRIYHTTTEILDTNLLLIYGGINTISDLPSNDSCYIYDTVHRDFISIQINTTRYGHFATAYDSSYLIFNFGYINSSTPADSLNILNVKDAFHPVWLMDNNTTTTTTTTETDDNKNNDDEHDHSRLKMNSSTVAAIVVPIVIVVVFFIIGSVYYILYRAHKPDPKRESVGFHGLQAELSEIRNSMLIDQAQIDELNEKMYLSPQTNQIGYDEPQSSQSNGNSQPSQINDNPYSNEMNQESQTSPKSGEDQNKQTSPKS